MLTNQLFGFSSNININARRSIGLFNWLYLPSRLTTDYFEGLASKAFAVFFSCFAIASSLPAPRLSKKQFQPQIMKLFINPVRKSNGVNLTPFVPLWASPFRAEPLHDMDIYIPIMRGN